MADVWIVTDVEPKSSRVGREDDPLFIALVHHTLARELIGRRELRAHAQLGVRVDADRKTLDAAYHKLRAQYAPETYTRFGADTVRIAERIAALLDDSYAYMTDATPRREVGAASPASRPSLGERTRQAMQAAVNRIRRFRP